MMTAFWFVYVTIVLVSYTAGLVNGMAWATMVHVHNPEQKPPPRTLADLVQDDAYEFSMVDAGFTKNFIMNVSTHHESTVIHKKMSQPGLEQNWVKSFDKGMKKVRGDKNLAFILPQLSAKIAENKLPCDLMAVPGALGARSYGFALPKNSQITQPLNEAILEMKETGDLAELEHKWVKENGECWNMSKSEKKPSMYLNQPKKMTMKMMWGVFVLLVVGILLSLGVSGLEIIYYNYRGNVSIWVTMCSGIDGVIVSLMVNVIV